MQRMRFAGPGGRPLEVPLHTVNTLIIGAGAASLRCAHHLHSLGARDMAVVVDRLGNGTSANSGSDKQTYYKIGISGDDPDSPMEFARTLFQGGMMHGDLAYVEGLLSAPAFFELCRLGVPFPFNRYGAYVGYKTDHDPRQRATSAGPKTSLLMSARLLEEVRREGVRIHDRQEAVKLLLSGPAGDPGSRVIGAVCLDRGEAHREDFGITVWNARNVVMGTGGPGEMYAVSVWPHGQIGSHGLALEAGAVGNNLTELQYGLASTAFRWNLSGTYQQVVPDYFSTASDGESERRHFLQDWFGDMPSMATAVFLKGYQWPFHAARVADRGSSAVDMAVHAEASRGRRVFLDFGRNMTPAASMRPFAISELEPEARRYLERSGALQATPYGRLRHMNQPSIDLYAEHGIDLLKPLEAAVCAQHCNGGLRGSLWWETSVPHLFAIGELAGTHGVRPGGSALNAGQVGAMRAAELIARAYSQAPPDPDAFADSARAQVEALHAALARTLSNPDPLALRPERLRREIQERMSREGAFIRSHEGASGALGEARELWRRIERHGMRVDAPRQLHRAIEDRALALTSVAFLRAIVHFIEDGGGSRGGYMVLDAKGDRELRLPDGSVLRYRSENQSKRGEILELSWDGDDDFLVRSVPVRPLPEDSSWFETVWNAWNAGQIVTPEPGAV
jgi:succinate dehydrogenase/fumarate reductase flavoprotein subunit